MTSQQHTEPPWIQMKAVGVWKSCKWVPRDYEIELNALKLVCRVDHHVRVAHCGQSRAEKILLFVVRNTYGDAFRLQLCPMMIEFASDFRRALVQSIDEPNDYIDCLWVGSEHLGVRKLNMHPAVPGGSIKCS